MKRFFKEAAKDPWGAVKNGGVVPVVALILIMYTVCYALSTMGAMYLLYGGGALFLLVASLIVYNYNVSKGFAGRGENTMTDCVNPATGLFMIGDVDSDGNPYGCSNTNPATGLPMNGGVDVAGNPMGWSGHD